MPLPSGIKLITDPSQLLYSTAGYTAGGQVVQPKTGGDLPTAPSANAAPAPSAPFVGTIAYGPYIPPSNQDTTIQEGNDGSFSFGTNSSYTATKPMVGGTVEVLSKPDRSGFYDLGPITSALYTLRPMTSDAAASVLSSASEVIDRAVALGVYLPGATTRIRVQDQVAELKDRAALVMGTLDSDLAELVRKAVIQSFVEYNAVAAGNSAELEHLAGIGSDLIANTASLVPNTIDKIKEGLNLGSLAVIGLALIVVSVVVHKATA